MNNAPNPNIVSIGLDVAKANFEAAIFTRRDDRARTLAKDAFRRDQQGLAQLVASIETDAAALELAEPQIRVVMEATGPYSRQLAEWLVAARPAWRVAVVNPRYVKAYGASLGARNKTDRFDARLIAQYGLEREPVWFEPLPETLKTLRALSRERDAIVRQVVETKNRTSDAYDAPALVGKAQKTLLRALENQRDRLEKEMKLVLERDKQWAGHFARLQTIPGVGPITAMVVLAELGDLRRFNRSRQLSAFVGTNPRVVTSGSSVRQRTRMSKFGNSRTRQALYLSAMAAVRSKKPNSLSSVYTRLVENGKARMSSLGAIMRRQLLIMRALMIHETYYQFQNQPVHNEA